MARITSIIILFALASIYNLYIHQMDVKIAFLNPKNLIYQEMKIKCTNLSNHCMDRNKLQNNGVKSLIMLFFLMGLLITMLINVCMLRFVIIFLYIDDMLILSNNMKNTLETKRFWSSIFKMKDLGEVDTILGVRVKQNKEGFALCQSYYYIEKVLKKFSHLNV